MSPIGEPVLQSALHHVVVVQPRVGPHHLWFYNDSNDKDDNDDDDEDDDDITAASSLLRIWLVRMMTGVADSSTASRNCNHHYHRHYHDLGDVMMKRADDGATTRNADGDLEDGVSPKEAPVFLLKSQQQYRRLV